MLKKILLSCFAIFGLTFFLSNNSYAVEDVSYTINSSSSTQICNTNSPKCSDYNYLIISDSSSSFPYRTDGNASFSIISPSGTLSYNIALGVSSSYFLNISDGDYRSISVSGLWLSSGQSFTVTLSENNPGGGITPEGSLSITSNGTYDVTNYASAIVNIDTDLPPYSQIVVDSFWQYHTAFGGAVVAIIAIFLVYRVLKGRLR